VIDLGISKMALIGAVALIVIGPEKLPRVARTVGTLLGKAQRYVNDVKAEVNRSMELDELRKMKESVETAARDVERSVRTGAADFEKQWSEALASPKCSPPRRQSPAIPNTAIPRRSGGSSRAPRPSGTRPATGCAPARCPGPPVSRVTARRSSTDCMSQPPSEDELAGTEQPFVAHLVELRDRLIKAVIAIAVCAGVLALWPGPSAMYDMLAAPLVAHLPKGATLIATNVISPFVVPLKILFMAAFMVALPVVLYQAWAFVAPGLYSHEKKLVVPLVVSSTVLFFAGVAFCYYFVFGQVFKFIQSFAPKSITAAPDIEEYLSFVIGMFLAFGLAFEVPVAVILLVRMGVVTVQQLRQWRGYFWVIAAVGTALVTPPDAGSMLILLAVVGGLYEVGILAAQLFVKSTAAPEEPAAADGA